MPYTIIVITGQVKMVADPVEERHLCIGVMSAHKENARMQQNQKINKSGELKPAIGNRQGSKRQQGWKHFQCPGEIVVRMNGGPRQNNCESAEQQQQSMLLFRQHQINSGMISVI